VGPVVAANRFVAEISCGANHLCRKGVDTCNRDEQDPLVADVDRRPEPRRGRLEVRAVQLGGDIVRVGVAQKAQRDVPPLWRDEANTDLILAMKRFQLLGRDRRQPQTYEQPTHPRHRVANVRRSDSGRNEEPPAGFATLWAMEVSISARPDASGALARVRGVLAQIPDRIVACSGGIDSLVLATVAHRAEPARTMIAHTITPAVSGDGTARVANFADREGWSLELVRSREFDDERYLANPTDRCYFCKTNLYDAIAEIGDRHHAASMTIVSGANLDDLGEYRPGLAAAAERGVRHPFVEAAISKIEIRAIARLLRIAEADLPSSPCLASRLYTGTRVTETRLRAIEVGESLVREMTGLDVVRCRITEVSTAGVELAVLIEVTADARGVIDDAVIGAVARVMTTAEPLIVSVELDDRPYESGRAFVHA
jgi:pyridinium-3,5-biscarboxylic acid mononucleotide sulfurtransferase